MLIRCPSCSSRHDFPHARLDPSGTLMDCRACGHGWIEGRAIDAGSVTVPAAEDDPEIRRLAAARKEAQQAFLIERSRRRRAALGWAGLAMLATAPLAIVLAFPERVVAAAPASIGLYHSLGQEVNIYGLEIRKVEIQHIQVDGEPILAVKGDITNVSTTLRKIPWLRFGLKASQGPEVYSWQLNTEARPLRPGESTGFVTRIAAPPKTARTVEIRFARADEIGSNAAP